MEKYKIADVVFSAEFIYKYSVDICAEFLYTGDEKPEFSIKVQQSDIESEKKVIKTEKPLPDSYIESLWAFRKICEYMLNNKDGIIFHSSAIAVGNEAFLFTAPSGTGKSTHAKLWKQLFGDKMTYINDDKPIIRLIDGEFYVFGTPWKGKHSLGTNACAKIKAIYCLERSKDNFVRKATSTEMISTVFRQTVKPNCQGAMEKLLGILANLYSKVLCFKLGVNMDISAAELAYSACHRGEL